MTRHPRSQTVVKGGVVAFVAAASGTPAPAVQWQMNANRNSAWVDIPGATSSVYRFTAGLEDEGRQYRAVFTNSTGTDSTQAATVEINAAAVTPICGQTIAADTTLGADLSCPADVDVALIVGASNITLNLGGHVLSGFAPLGRPGVGVLANHVNGIAIRNGSIEEFGLAVSLNGVHGAVVEDMSVSNLRITNDAQLVTGVNIGDGSTGVVVTNSQFEFPPLVFHKGAVGVGASDVVVSNIVVHGGGGGVGFGYAYTCDPLNRPSNGEVLNSRFIDSRMGVMAFCSTNVRIAGNEFDCPSGPGWCVGIQVYGPFAGSVSGVRTEGNTIRNSYIGIDYEGISQSTATNNMVTASTGWGIGLRQTQGEDFDPIFPPAGNTISGNIVWGNAIDLFDDGAGQANTWVGNVCATKRGAAIPACSPLAIVTNPSSQSVAAGMTASFTASATYTGWQPNFTPNVQWQVSTNGGLTWASVAGATLSTYTFTATLADSGKQYRAIFTNSSGTATTVAAALTVSGSPSAPVVTTQPSNQTVSAGQTATFSAAASGVPTPAVRWQVSRDSGTTWVDILAGTNPTYSMTTWVSDSGSQYRAVFTSGSGSATTTPATLTVTRASSGPSVTAQPSSQTAPAGQAAVFYAAASGNPPPLVQWQVSADGGSTWADINGAVLPVYTFTTTAADNGKRYRAVFTNSLGTVTTAAATLTLGPNAVTIVCGTTITANTILTADLSCPSETSYALAIGASNVTLDLGGHVLSGAPLAEVGVLVGNVNGVTIRNGTIKGFDRGVSITGAVGVTLEGVSVDNLQALDPSHYLVGVNIAGSSGIAVRDSRFASAPGVAGKSAIDVYASDVAVSDIEVSGGVGVNFSFPGTCDPVHGPSNGDVFNSRFIDAIGVLVQCSSRVRIMGNSFDCPTTPGTCEAVSASGPSTDAVTGLRVEGNTIRNEYIGIDYHGVSQSTATNNTVSASTGYGIALRQAGGNSGWAIFPPAGNKISGNIAWGSVTDLYDDGTGQGNSWTGNICASRQGAAIPACSPLAIVTNPSSQSVAAGMTASFTASATYTGWQPNFTPNVQWQVSANGGLTWTSVAGATLSTYTFTAALADSGKQYRAVFTNNGGTATTAVATLTVGGAPSAPVVTAQPSNQNLTAGQTVAFSAAASGVPTPAVRWQVSQDGGATWVDILAGTNSTYSFTAELADSRKQFRAVFTNSVGSAVTKAATLAVLGISRVVNAASFQPVISPGAWISIFGEGLASTTRVWRGDEIVDGRLPTQLDDVRVTIDGKPTAVSYISPTQLNVQAPDDATTGPVVVLVTNAWGTTSATAQMQPFSPALFTFDGSHVAAQHSDGSYVGGPNLLAGVQTTVARPGETLILWGTGLGPSDPPTPAGQLVMQAAALANEVTVLIGGAQAVVKWAGISATGLWQFNVLMPMGVAPEDATLVLKVGGVSTQSNVLLTIGPQ